ncbi:MAG: DUF3108 domain-containing protein [Desulfobaccales bacterium]
MCAGRICLIIILLLLRLAPATLAAGPATLSAAPEIRENLEYQISLGPWSDVARVHLVLKELKPGHYLAEFSGAAQGMWRLLKRWLPERYQTEMLFRDGRLQPMVYREEFQEKGHKVLKEYRFDYDHSRLTLWRQVDGGKKIKEWEVPLTGPVYDLLSLFYNVRLGALGPTPGGATLRVMVLPNPKPQELVFFIGAATDQGLKVMVNSCSPGAVDEDQYFIFLGPERVPTLAWTRVTLFGKLAGRLLNPGDIKKEGLLTLPPPLLPSLKPHAEDHAS